MDSCIRHWCVGSFRSGHKDFRHALVGGHPDLYWEARARYTAGGSICSFISSYAYHADAGARAL